MASGGFIFLTSCILKEKKMRYFQVRPMLSKLNIHICDSDELLVHLQNDVEKKLDLDLF